MNTCGRLIRISAPNCHLTVSHHGTPSSTPLLCRKMLRICGRRPGLCTSLICPFMQVRQLVPGFYPARITAMTTYRSRAPGGQSLHYD